jgi:hypothetical protein
MNVTLVSEFEAMAKVRNPTYVTVEGIVTEVNPVCLKAWSVNDVRVEGKETLVSEVDP